MSGVLLFVRIHPESAAPQAVLDEAVPVEVGAAATVRDVIAELVRMDAAVEGTDLEFQGRRLAYDDLLADVGLCSQSVAAAVPPLPTLPELGEVQEPSIWPDPSVWPPQEDKDEEGEERPEPATLFFELDCMGRDPKGVFRKGTYVVHRGSGVEGGRPAKVLEISTSKTGKCGLLKVMIKSRDLMRDGKTYNMIIGRGPVEVPVLRRQEFRVIDANDRDGSCTLQDDDGDFHEDYDLPSAITDSALRKVMLTAVDEGSELFVTVLSTMGEARIESARRED
eukprot:Hpha_TRINITY_DN14555_c0_g1::TRINITY_DN14555_c0_g1_i1::g.46665::m.46665/K03263/EIF5A; translation initiation factor 5A